MYFSIFYAFYLLHCGHLLALIELCCFHLFCFPFIFFFAVELLPCVCWIVKLFVELFVVFIVLCSLCCVSCIVFRCITYCSVYCTVCCNVCIELCLLHCLLHCFLFYCAHCVMFVVFLALFVELFLLLSLCCFHRVAFVTLQSLDAFVLFLFILLPCI